MHFIGLVSCFLNVLALASGLVSLTAVGNPARLPVIINSSHYKYFSIDFRTAYSLYFSNECPDFAKTSQHSPLASSQHQFVTGTGLFTPNSFYSFLIQNDSQLYTVLISERTDKGYALRVNFSMEVVGVNPGLWIQAYAVIQVPQNYSLVTDGVVGLPQLAKALGQTKPGSCNRISLTKRYDLIDINLGCEEGDFKSEFLESLQVKTVSDQGYLGVDLTQFKINGQTLYSGSQLQLDLQRETVLIPKSIIKNTIDAIQKSGTVKCHVKNSQFYCISTGQPELPALHFEVNAGKVQIEIQGKDYLQSCQQNDQQYECLLALQLSSEQLFGFNVLKLGQTVLLDNRTLYYMPSTTQTDLLSGIHPTYIWIAVAYLGILIALRGVYWFRKAFMKEIVLKQFADSVNYSNNSLSSNQTESDNQSERSTSERI